MHEVQSTLVSLSFRKKNMYTGRGTFLTKGPWCTYLRATASCQQQQRRRRQTSRTNDDERRRKDAACPQGHNAGDADRWGTATLGGRPGNGGAALFLPCERGSHTPPHGRAWRIAEGSGSGGCPCACATIPSLCDVRRQAAGACASGGAGASGGARRYMRRELVAPSGASRGT